jgi:hypothetical protein
MTASSGDHPENPAKDFSTNGHATSNGPQRGHTTTPFRSDRSLAEEPGFEPAGPRKQETLFRRAFFDRFGLQNRITPAREGPRVRISLPPPVSPALQRICRRGAKSRRSQGGFGTAQGDGFVGGVHDGGFHDHGFSDTVLRPGFSVGTAVSNPHCRRRQLLHRPQRMRASPPLFYYSSITGRRFWQRFPERGRYLSRSFAYAVWE